MSDDEKLLKRLRSAAKHPMMDNSCKADVFDVTKAADRIEELEAALAKTVSALNVIDALDPEAAINGFSESALRGLVLRMGELARTTLAELKGEDRG